MQGYRWILSEAGKPLRREKFSPRAPGDGEVVVEVLGCGLCHTDLGFRDGDVKPRAPLPIVLGHEIAGTVVAVGPGADAWAGKDVVVAAVIPCGDCPTCASGRGNMCTRQFMPGNDGDGGFATHVVVKAVGLTEVERPLPKGLILPDLAVIADAVTTALQAVRRARVAKGDLAIVVGAGGVGSFAVQCAAAAGARVIALDVNEERLEVLAHHGASRTVLVRGMNAKAVRDAVRSAAAALDCPPWAWKIFECSGTPQGQEAAWGLLVPAATLAVVGFTREPIPLRLSNLMAFDADAFGTWGCPIERYPEAVRMVVAGEIALQPFIRHVPLDEIEQVFTDVRLGQVPKRTVLIP
jgi:6-hydroxycyclohex-1-ene-1-carbonyl-CoA dehydrogenase